MVRSHAQLSLEEGCEIAGLQASGGGGEIT